MGTSQRSTACLSICINTKIEFSILVGQNSTWGGVKRKPHTDPEVQVGYMVAIDKLVPDEEECAVLRSELSKYLSDIGPFGTLHARKDRDRAPPIELWNMYGSSCPHLHKLAAKVLSHVVNSSSTESCWSTYSFIHSMKRN